MNLSLRVQFLIIALASVALLSLAAFLIWDVISRTETQRLEEARRQVAAACEELRLQYEQREVFTADDPLELLPPEMQDLSLRGLSETVLRTYEAVQGGFFFIAADQVLGASGGPITPEIRAFIAGVSRDAHTSRIPAAQTLEHGVDTIVAQAAPVQPDAVVAWSIREITGLRDPVFQRRQWMLGALVLSALLGMAAVISVWYSLQSGVNSVRRGLAQLERDFQYRLPEGGGDFGQIATAINQMAARRLALETELRRQDRLAALGKAIAGVAHEIRNPLNSLKLTLELVSRRLAKGTATGEEIRGASSEVDRLDQIVGRLLAFGRPALADRQVQDPTPLIDQAVRMVSEQARRKDVEIRVIHHAAGLEADVDGPQLQQVLINLLLNAIDASPRGDKVEVSAGRHADRMVIRVSDRGPGIPEEAQPHIFDVYFTTKPDGVGLGLSVSREIVVNHGGTLEFTSRPGETEFVMTVPATRSATIETESLSSHRRG